MSRRATTSPGGYVSTRTARATEAAIAVCQDAYTGNREHNSVT